MITDDCEQAVQEVIGFYRNYDSLRYVGDTLIIRLQQRRPKHSWPRSTAVRLPVPAPAPSTRSCRWSPNFASTTG